MTAKSNPASDRGRAAHGHPTDQSAAAGHWGLDHADPHAGHDKHAGHHPDMFRDRFWFSLVLTLPIVATSPMIMAWFGYALDFRGVG